MKLLESERRKKEERKRKKERCREIRRKSIKKGGGRENDRKIKEGKGG